MTVPFVFLAVLGAAPCSPASGDARAILASAAAETGLRSLGQRVFHVQGFDVESQDFQSDRMYPPYLSTVDAFDTWFSPATGVERRGGASAPVALGRGGSPGGAAAQSALTD
jgi:hypothetical protein